MGDADFLDALIVFQRANEIFDRGAALIEAI